jgi:hypothetical protein
VEEQTSAREHSGGAGMDECVPFLHPDGLPAPPRRRPARPIVVVEEVDEHRGGVDEPEKADEKA